MFVRFWVRASPAEALSIASPNVKKRQLWFLAKPYSYDVVSTDLDGVLSKVNAAVSNAYPQNKNRRSVRDIIDRTISHKVRLRCPDTPLLYGVPGGFNCETIPQCLK